MPSTRDIIRSIDEKIAALQNARNALLGAFSDESEPSAPPARAARKVSPNDTITLPQALDSVVTGDWRSPAEITDALIASKVNVGAKVNVGTVRTALSRLHKDKGWSRRSLAGGFVKYRKGQPKSEEVTTGAA